MRFSGLLTALAALPLFAHAANKSKFVDLANQSKDGIITLNSALYEELLAPEPTASGGKGRDYAVAVVLTALPVEMNCAPCRTFDPIFKQEAASWKRLPKDQREDMFFAVLDFSDGQQIFQKVSYDVRCRCRKLMLRNHSSDCRRRRTCSSTAQR
jgi:oligosaccharyltransferase complex subunit gamma